MKLFVVTTFQDTDSGQFHDVIGLFQEWQVAQAKLEELYWKHRGNRDCWDINERTWSAERSACYRLNDGTNYYAGDLVSMEVQ